MLMTSLVAVVEDTTDEFDISADTAKVSELGIPTTSSVAELKKKADELWNAGDYQEAAEAFFDLREECELAGESDSSGM